MLFGGVLGVFLNPQKTGNKGGVFFLGRGCLKHFLCYTPKIGEDELILTSIFFRWVETTNQFCFGGGDSWFLTKIFSQMMVYPAV